MSVSTEILARKYLNPVAGTPINVDYPLFAEAHCVVLYGVVGLPAILDTDFTLTLNDPDYEDFILTPTASLRTKIDALLVADPTETDQIVVRRDMPMLTDMTPTLARLRDQIALEFDRTALRLQQLQEEGSRSLQMAETDVSGDSNVLPTIPADRGIKRNATGDGWVATDNDPDEQANDAAASAAAALVSENNAATSESNAAVSETNAGNSETAAASSETNAAASAVLAQNAANSGLYKQVIDKNANYTIVVADQGALFQVDTSGGNVTITLELLATLGEDFRIAVSKMTGDANTVTVQRTGSDTVNGGASIVMDAQYAVYNFIGDMDDGEWLASDASIASIPDATETVKGIVELATQAEVDAGVDAVRAITPATLEGAAKLSAISVQVFTASGTYTPTAGVKYIVAEMVGGGASGGQGGPGKAGGGGGGGAYTRKVIAAASLGATEAITIGAGGAAVSGSAAAGNAGGTTSLGALLTAVGGGAGDAVSNAGNGGTASGGDVNIDGGNGSYGNQTSINDNGDGGDSGLGHGGAGGPNTGSAPRGFGGGAAGTSNTNGGSNATGGVVVITEYA